MEIKGDLIVAVMLSILFTIGFFYLFVTIPSVLHEILLPFIPDPYFSGRELEPLYDSIVKEFGLIGSVIFLLLIVLIILGVIIKRFDLSFLGSFTLYLPIFANFCFIMFMFAGLGITRLLWYPIIQINPSLLELGDFIPPLYFLGSDLFYFIYSLIPPPLDALIFFFLDFSFLFQIMMLIFLLIGLGIFIFSVITWFYGKFSGIHLLDFWIYKYSRHPQYLGLLIWSYSLTGLLASLASSPTIIWLISALFIVGAAIQEENHLMMVFKEEHEKWRQTTPFLLPVPTRISNGIQWLVRHVIKKDWPSNHKEILMVLAFFGIMIIFSSMLLGFVVGILSEIFSSLHGLIDWYH
ncbi:MAG: methyltransferase family protein [Candidatus Thorarchaeota archaeon]